MRTTIFSWLDHEFVALCGEAPPGASAAEEAERLFRRFESELHGLGLSLDHVVRTRLWGRDRRSRDLGSEARLRILSGKARSASSSYIAPVHFDSAANVALDLLAMRPARPDSRKQVVEYDPPIVPIRFLVYEAVVVLSGVTAVLPSLETQLDDILPRIEASLRDAGSSWDRAAKVSFFLHRSQRLESLKELFHRRVRTRIPEVEYCHVDGYSAEGKLCEIEVTASL
ncbi:MAG TPA: hypothetical protein VNO43_08075 [Candidatus Eisenbacteria bacterium]|nr:hypothetical protein [Candidatus Eisenbacteria bacterium]